MWDKRKLLIAAIIFTALCYKVAAEGAKMMDMATDAVDYVYSACREQALKTFIYSDLLTRELQKSKEFKEAWNSSTKCSKQIPGKTDKHTAALWAYNNVNENVLKEFNNAVETMGKNASTYENFNFKSLHFLLMDSMIEQPQNNCKILYASPDKKYTATNGSKVRFGHFMVAHLSSDIVKDFDLDDGVVFIITSCFFANLGENICSEESDVLLSPAEMFTVEDIKKKTDKNDATYTEITLKHSKVAMSSNCNFFSRSVAVVSTQWLVLVLVALSLFFF